jgi:hypothetical protein
MRYCAAGHANLRKEALVLNAKGEYEMNPAWQRTLMRAHCTDPAIDE